MVVVEVPAVAAGSGLLAWYSDCYAKYRVLLLFFFLCMPLERDRRTHKGGVHRVEPVGRATLLLRRRLSFCSGRAGIREGTSTKHQLSSAPETATSSARAYRSGGDAWDWFDSPFGCCFGALQAVRHPQAQQQVDLSMSSGRPPYHSLVCGRTTLLIACRNLSSWP